MTTLLQDVRYGWRLLARRPGFTLLALATLALGIGSSTAMFSAVHGVLLRPLPYHEPERLVRVWDQALGSGFFRLGLSEPELLVYRESQQTLQGIAAYDVTGANLSGSGQPARVRLARVTPNLFPMLGVEPSIGRRFRPEEELPGEVRVAILSHGLWQREFGASESVLNRSVELDGKSYVVIGVMPPGFAFPLPGPDLWAPFTVDPTNLHSAGDHNVSALARLKPGVSLSQATVDIHRVAWQYALDGSDTTEQELAERGWGAFLEPLRESQVGDSRRALVILLGATGFVLLIACANVANLLLARATSRKKEIAVRAALGAGRGRIVSQLLTESVTLSLLGGVAGLLVARLGLDLLRGIATAVLPRPAPMTLDLRVLAFALTVSLATGVLFGLAPAIQGSRVDLNDAFQQSGRGLSGGRQKHLRNLLAVGEVALALVLLIGAGLLMRSFYNMLQVDPGYRTANLLTMRLALPVADYSSQAVLDFDSRLIDRVRALPGVESVGGISDLPLEDQESYGWGRINVERPSAAFRNDDPKSPYPYVFADRYSIAGDYLRTLDINLVEGRRFNGSDGADSAAVAIVDRALAQRFWPDESALGRRIGTGNPRNPRWRTIVGVVEHVRHWVQAEGRPQVYFPYSQVTFHSLFLAVQTTVPPETLVEPIRAEVRSLDPRQPVFDVSSMEGRLAGSLSRARFNGLLLGLFALLASVLAAIGVYGVIAYSVAQRTRELGIRVALGAQPRQVLRLILGQGLRLGGAGVLIGIPVAIGLTRFVNSLLFETSPTDPVTFAGITGCLILLVLLACYLPARRAMRVDPTTALRCE